jgi:hypothetical protein
MATKRRKKAEEPASALQVPAESVAEQVKPWERLENGRYMPRRIRGSYHGRELG